MFLLKLHLDKHNLEIIFYFKYKGVWIENDFKSKFDSNRSMAEIVKNYQNADFGIYPIGLRINNLEIKNNEINIVWVFYIRIFLS